MQILPFKARSESKGDQDKFLRTSPPPLRACAFLLDFYFFPIPIYLYLLFYVHNTSTV